MILSLDTESTGLDVQHGTRPFLVTIADENLENTFWEWDVDPLTRKVLIPRNELLEVWDYLADCETVVLQNAKFDVGVIEHACKDLGIVREWPWHKTIDTLYAAHLVASNKPKDLTSLAVQYIGQDPSKYDKECEQIVKKCMAFVRKRDSPVSGWRISKKGLEEMPSAKEKVWKSDLWLPKALANTGFLDDELTEEELVKYRTSVSEYANSDSVVTLAIWKVLEQKIKSKGLWDIFEQRLKLMPIIHRMEQKGVTCNKSRLKKIKTQFKLESVKTGRTCRRIAKKREYDLQLPKSGNNKSLSTFCFEHLKLPVLATSPKTGAPTLDKHVLEEYQLTLEGTKLEFVDALVKKRKRDTALSYMEGYEKFWLSKDLSDQWYTLFPSLNSTGTKTLRFSSSNPNEQNISKKDETNLRYIFGPAPGREWWSCDARNIELRIPAYESGETELIRLFESPEEPPYYGSTHLLNFHTVYPDIWDKELKVVGIDNVGPHCKKVFADVWYQRCKNGGFACQYGAVEKQGDPNKRTTWGTADKAFHRYGCHSLLKSRFARLEKLNQSCIDHAEDFGFVSTIPDTSVCAERGYPLECGTMCGRVKPTIPLNYHIQSTAMWWMCQAMIACQKLLDEWKKHPPLDCYNRSGFEGFIVMQVHDELVFDLPAGKGKNPERTNLPLVKELVAEMENGGNGISVPTPVGAEYHSTNWSEGIVVI